MTATLENQAQGSAVTKTPLVSVIIPAFRNPDFLNQALASVKNQTYPAIEIIIVDDASGKEFTDRYRIPENGRLIVNEVRQSRAAISRNTALRTARGEFIAFLDQDDLWLPEKVEAQVWQLQTHPEALLHFVRYLGVDESLIPISQSIKHKSIRDPLAAFIHSNWVNPSQVMMRRSAFESHGTFDESILGASDWDMWMRVAATGRHSVIEDQRLLVKYRYHGGQWSKSELMMVKACNVVLSKAATWVPQCRPDLRFLLRRRRGRWQRELARIRLKVGEELDQVWPALWTAWRLWPMDPKVYQFMLRAFRMPRRVVRTTSERG